MRLRLQALVFFGLVLSFVALDVMYQPGADSPLEIPRAAVEVLMTLGAWGLVAFAVHEEPLTGDREFWPTRPYDRRSLFLAKLMVLGTTISLPLFLADCAIVGLQGLPVFPNAAGLVLRSPCTAIWLILPPLAIAALTRDSAQYALGWFLMAIYAIVIVQWESGSPFLGNDYPWTIIWVLAASSALILAMSVWLQYRGAGLVRGPRGPLPWRCYRP